MSSAAGTLSVCIFNGVWSDLGGAGVIVIIRHMGGIEWAGTNSVCVCPGANSTGRLEVFFLPYEIPRMLVPSAVGG